jgi:thiosulfate dehydrogenase (quinone) large subunit
VPPRNSARRGQVRGRRPSDGGNPGGAITSAEADARRLGWALFPVRLFLGVTFIYGGIQKLSDPGFLHPGAPTYIGTQLRGFANGTPGGFLLRTFAIPHPKVSGVGVALVEIAVGLLVSTGLLTRAAAAGGLALNLLLFLTNSWHTYPYFLGSDIVFVFAWVPFVLVGAIRQPTLEPVLHRIALARMRRDGPAAPVEGRNAAPRPGAAPGDEALTRRSAIGAAMSLVAAATATIAGLSLLLRGSYRPARTLSASARPARTPPATTHTRTGTAAGETAGSSTSASSSAAAAGQGLPPRAVKLGAGSQLPNGQAATYTDPGDGQPDIIIREGNGTLVAHSAVCTHAGCTVGYQGGQLVCPCHGSIFNAQTGAVITGPAVTPLPARTVIEHAGEIYAVPA